VVKYLQVFHTGTALIIGNYSINLNLIVCNKSHGWHWWAIAVIGMHCLLLRVLGVLKILLFHYILF